MIPISRTCVGSIGVSNGDPIANREAFLRALPLLADVPEAILAEFRDGAGSSHYERGERIFSEGDEAHTFYLVRSGWVKIMRETASGKSVLFELLGPGDIVGAVAVMDKRPFPATALAASAVELLTLPGNVFAGLAQRCPQLQANYAREIGHRMREARDWQTQVAAGIEGRIAQLFLRLAERVGHNQSDQVVFPRILTRQEIADMVGTTVETAIRTLSRWNKEKLVLSEEESFVICDPQRLATLAENG